MNPDKVCIRGRRKTEKMATSIYQAPSKMNAQMLHIGLTKSISTNFIHFGLIRRNNTTNRKEILTFHTPKFLSSFKDTISNTFTFVGFGLWLSSKTHFPHPTDGTHPP